MIPLPPHPTDENIKADSQAEYQAAQKYSQLARWIRNVYRKEDQGMLTSQAVQTKHRHDMYASKRNWMAWGFRWGGEQETAEKPCGTKQSDMMFDWYRPFHLLSLFLFFLVVLHGTPCVWLSLNRWHLRHIRSVKKVPLLFIHFAFFSQYIFPFDSRPFFSSFLCKSRGGMISLLCKAFLTWRNNF